MQLLHHNAAEFAEKSSVKLVKAVVSQREIKTTEELEQIEEAVNISVDMHIAAMQMARPGIKEYEIAARVHEIALAANGNISFPIISYNFV